MRTILENWFRSFQASPVNTSITDSRADIGRHKLVARIEWVRAGGLSIGELLWQGRATMTAVKAYSRCSETTGSIGCQAVPSKALDGTRFACQPADHGQAGQLPSRSPRACSVDSARNGSVPEPSRRSVSSIYGTLEPQCMRVVNYLIFRSEVHVSGRFGTGARKCG